MTPALIGPSEAPMPPISTSVPLAWTICSGCRKSLVCAMQSEYIGSVRPP